MRSTGSPSPGSREAGFTLIELLVVMIIIGILAAIAIPVFLSQRTKAQDAAVKSDVSTMGKELATYYVDNNAPPTLSITAGRRYALVSADAPAPGEDLGPVSTNVLFTNQFIVDDTHWCVTLNNPKGQTKTFKYSASGGMSAGTCTDADG